MKAKIFLIAIAAVGLIFQSCSDDDNGIKVAPEIEAAFKAQFPEATNVRWERKATFYVAEFSSGNVASVRSEAWYTGGAMWMMTETDITFEQLPEAVKTTHKAGAYSTWRVDDVDMLERKGMERIYVVEVELGKEEFDLYYSADGMLIKAIPDSDNTSGSHLPEVIPSAIADFIATKYPNAKIVDLDIEIVGATTMIEVDIADGRVVREVLFNVENKWIATKTEIAKADVPANVLQVLAASEYGSYEIDDIDHFDSPTGVYYIFELELGAKEVDVKITSEGVLEVVKA